MTTQQDVVTILTNGETLANTMTVEVTEPQEVELSRILSVEGSIDINTTTTAMNDVAGGVSPISFTSNNGKYLTIANKLSEVLVNETYNDLLEEADFLMVKRNISAVFNKDIYEKTMSLDELYEMIKDQPEEPSTVSIVGVNNTNIIRVRIPFIVEDESDVCVDLQLVPVYDTELDLQVAVAITHKIYTTIKPDDVATMVPIAPKRYTMNPYIVDVVCYIESEIKDKIDKRIDELLAAKSNQTEATTV